MIQRNHRAVEGLLQDGERLCSRACVVALAGDGQRCGACICVVGIAEIEVRAGNQRRRAMLDRRGGQNGAAGVGCRGHIGNHVGGDRLCRHGDGDGIGAVVRRAGVNHGQCCAGGIRFLHRDGGRCGIRAGDNL